MITSIRIPYTPLRGLYGIRKRNIYYVHSWNRGYKIMSIEEDYEYKLIRTDKVLSNSQKREKKLEYLTEKYGYFLSLPASCLPDEHRAKLGGGLRCFSFVFNRTDEGTKIKGDKKRCGNPVVKGSFFCKKHGGGNSHNLVHGRNMNPMLSAYKKTYDGSLGDLLTCFVNDKDITDMRPELLSLRVVLNNYVSKLIDGKPANPKRFVKEAKNIVNAEELTDIEKFVMLKDLSDSVHTLTDGDSIDRLARVTETVSRVIERINKTQSKDDFILTPEGLRIFLRAIVDVINDHVLDENIKRSLHEALINISIKTGGDLSKYKTNLIEADYIVE